MIFNSINTNSAGTSNVTRTILNEGNIHELGTVIVEDNMFFDGFKNIDHVRFIKFGRNPIFRAYKRVLFDFVTFPRLVRKSAPEAVYILANYCPVRLTSKKVVIMRHPYLVDRDSWKEIKTYSHFFKEILRKFLFKLTLRSTDILVVQTKAMEDMFLREYPNFRGGVRILGNPVSNSTQQLASVERKEFDEEYKYLFYPSRYYSHKNHEFLIDFAIKYREFMTKEKMKFVITLSDVGEGSGILKLIVDNDLNDYFYNIGEVDKDELNIYYKKSFCLFYPSMAETFGNCIIEAQYAGLPIVIMDKPYATTLCSSSAIYFDDIKSAKNSLEICSDSWSIYSCKSRSMSEKYLSSNEWLNKLISF